MFNIKFKYLLSVGALASFGSFADTAGIVLKFDHPQVMSVSLSSSSDYLNTYQSGVKNTSTWRIKSNNGVNIGFSGASPEGNGIVDFPRFYKQEVNARGELIPSQYSYLETTFGVTIINYDSIERGVTRELTSDLWYSIWGGGIFTTGTPELLADASNTLSPNGYWGTIMPNDQGEFLMSLYAEGVASANSQSGNYTMSVILNLTADEQINP
jgi:hypothetical protein